MRIFDEEAFGPAAAVVRAKDSDEAIDLANASSYGLGFSIWTRDTTAAARSLAESKPAPSLSTAWWPAIRACRSAGLRKWLRPRTLHFGVHEFMNVQTVWVGF